MKNEDRRDAYLHAKMFKNIIAHIALNPDKTSWDFKNKLKLEWLKKASIDVVCDAFTSKDIHDGTDTIDEFKVGGYYASIAISRTTGGLSGGGRTLIYKIGKGDTVIFDHVEDTWIS